MMIKSLVNENFRKELNAQKHNNVYNS